MTFVNINPNTSVKISKESRALLERAHKDGIIRMYGATLEEPKYDDSYRYFAYSEDFTIEERYSFSRFCTTEPKCLVTVEQLEKMLYPMKHNLVEGDAVKITPGSHAVVRELAKKYNVPLFKDMEEDSYEDEMNFNCPARYYRFSVNQIIRNDVNVNLISLDEFALKMMGSYKPSYVEVKLNEQHVAVVSKNNIKVGCQSFPHSIVGELQKAIEQFAE